MMNQRKHDVKLVWSDASQTMDKTRPLDSRARTAKVTPAAPALQSTASSPSAHLLMSAVVSAPASRPMGINVPSFAVQRAKADWCYREAMIHQEPAPYLWINTDFSVIHTMNDAIHWLSQIPPMKRNINDWKAFACYYDELSVMFSQHSLRMSIDMYCGLRSQSDVDFSLAHAIAADANAKEYFDIAQKRECINNVEVALITYTEVKNEMPKEAKSDQLDEQRRHMARNILNSNRLFNSRENHFNTELAKSWLQDITTKKKEDEMMLKSCEESLARDETMWRLIR